MTLPRNPWFYAALLLALLLLWRLLAPPAANEAAALSAAERRRLAKREAQLQAQAAADSARVAPLLDTAATHYATATHLLYEKLPAADSAARLHYLDSAVATW